MNEVDDVSAALTGPGNGERWAVYYAPPVDHPLWAAGCRWLGRDPESGERFPPPPGIDPERWRRATPRPARYGFHATLQPPLCLHSKATSATLRDSVAAIAAGSAPFTLPDLTISRVDGFLALRPREPCSALDALAAACVRDLDPLRAPATEKELERHQRAGLSEHQESLLTRWGYPFVLDQFQFHMTLTRGLPAAEQATLRPLLETYFESALAAPPPTVADLCLYHQPAAGAEFCLNERFPLGASGNNRSLHKR